MGDEMTPEQMREHLLEAPEPMVGPGIYERAEEGEFTKDDGYDFCGRSLARAMLAVCEADPTLLDVPSREEDESGLERAHNDKLWEAVKETYPGIDKWLGGPTGFQYGWAHNAVRYVLEREPVGNPAIMTIGSG